MIKVRVLPGIGRELTLPLPQEVVREMKWSVGDEIVIDVMWNGKELIVYKEGTKD